MGEANEIFMHVQRIENKIEHLETQSKRDIAHRESERDVRTEQGKRIDRAISAIERLEKMMDKHDIILFNSGRGIMFEIDRLKQDKERKNSNVPIIIATAGLLIAIGTAIIMVIK